MDATTLEEFVGSTSFACAHKIGRKNGYTKREINSLIYYLIKRYLVAFKNVDDIIKEDKLDFYVKRSVEITHMKCITQDPRFQQCHVYAPIGLFSRLAGVIEDEEETKILTQACQKTAGSWKDVENSVRYLMDNYPLDNSIWYLSYTDFGKVPKEFRGTEVEFGEFNKRTDLTDIYLPFINSLKNLIVGVTDVEYAIFQTNDYYLNKAHFMALEIRYDNGFKIVVCDTDRIPNKNRNEKHIKLIFDRVYELFRNS